MHQQRQQFIALCNPCDVSLVRRRALSMACAMAHWQVTEAVRCGTPSGGLPLAGGSQLRVLGGVIVTEGDRGVTERRSAVPLSCVAIRRVGCTRSAASVHAQGAHYGIARVACGPCTDNEAVRRAIRNFGVANTELYDLHEVRSAGVLAGVGSAPPRRNRGERDC